MIDVHPFPTTAAELQELGPGIHRFPASFEEYLAALPETELHFEYVDDHIIATSYATLYHEAIIAEIILLLGGLERPRFSIIGSNHQVFLPEMPRAFAPDVFVIKGKPKRIRMAGRPSMIANPWLIVEILSQGTAPYDLGTKLPSYQKFPSAAYILYVYQDEERATLHTRVDDALWRSEDAGPDSPPLQIGDLFLSVADIYRNLPSEEEE